MNRFQRGICVLGLPLLLTLPGCIVVTDKGDWDHDGDYQVDWEHLERKNRAAISALSQTTTPTTLQAQLGEPAFVDTMRKGEHHYQVLYYRTHRVKSDGETTRDECTAVVFMDEVLMGTGELALANLAQ